MIEAIGIVKTYKKKKVVDNINMSLKEAKL